MHVWEQVWEQGQEVAPLLYAHMISRDAKGALLPHPPRANMHAFGIASVIAATLYEAGPPLLPSQS